MKCSTRGLPGHPGDNQAASHCRNCSDDYFARPALPPLGKYLPQRKRRSAVLARALFSLEHDDRYVRSENLLGEVWTTLERILVGFAMGAIPGVIVGLLMGISWPVRAFLMPIATAIYAIPKIALLPLVLSLIHI